MKFKDYELALRKICDAERERNNYKSSLPYDIRELIIGNSYVKSLTSETYLLQDIIFGLLDDNLKSYTIWFIEEFESATKPCIFLSSDCQHEYKINTIEDFLDYIKREYTYLT